jgi:hypothetical protein
VQSAAAGDPSAGSALGALALSDQQQGLIDQRAAEAIARRTADLLAALASRDPASVADQLAQFAKRVDALAASGHIATPAAAEALKAAAASLSGTLLPDATGSPPAATGGDGGNGEGAPLSPGGGDRGHRPHHGGGDAHD